MLESPYLQSYAQFNGTLLINGTTKLTSMQLFLEFLGACCWKLISRRYQRPVYSLTFALVEKPASQTGVLILELGAW